MTVAETKFYTEADAELTRTIGIVDSHNDLALAVLKRRHDGVYDSLRTYWIPRLRAGGVKVVVCPVCVPSAYLPDFALRFTIQCIDALYQEIEENGGEIELARSFADIQRINAAGKIAALLSFEGAEMLGQDLSALRLFYQVGLRMLSFTWMRRTFFGDGTWENESRGGLTRLGRAAVKEMNRLGIIVDVSHASDQTTWDIIETSSKTVIASHSNARAVQNHKRNLTDDMIKAIAAKGGVVGVVAVSRFVADGVPTIGQWVDHVEHIVRIAGIDHVGIGADFADHLYAIGASQGVADWSPEQHAKRYPFTGMLDPDDLPGLTAELVRRGFSERDLRKISHENHLRVMADILR
ncbi:MAG: membrane dipeptidase [Chloroflexi bacterium]|nr:membrane dipeptidase [Chloroflexota bacterium]